MSNYAGWGNQARLPAGWEAKWDPGSRRWFYIDHHTKTTHWELPKNLPRQTVVPRADFLANLKAQYPQAHQDIIKQVLVDKSNNFMQSKMQLQSMGYQMKQEVIADAKLAKQLVSEHISVSQTFAESLLIQHNNDIHAVKRALGAKGYQKRAVIQPVARHIKTLLLEFPDADEQTIKQVLVSNSNVIQHARSTMEVMGYKKAGKSQPQQAPKKSTSPKKSTTPKKLTETEKKRRLNDLKRKFPGLSERIIEMSLEGTDYNADLAGSVLKRSLESVNAKTSNTATTETGTSASAESSEYKSASLEPVIFGDDGNQEDPFPYTPKISTTPSSSVPKQAAYTIPERAARIKVTVEKRVFTKKQVPSGYVSRYRCTPSGPNPDLVSGSNHSLLQEFLIKPTGPNVSHRCGPLPSNRFGPDPGMKQGTGGLAVGPMSKILLETMI